MWRGWRKDRERELQEELEAGLAIDIQQRIEAGCEPEEARYAARRAFGNVTRTKEVIREIGMVWICGTSLDPYGIPNQGSETGQFKLTTVSN
jgi:hypothetical protein